MMATKLAVLMMDPWDPPGLLRIALIASLQPHQTPLRLMVIVRSQIFSSVLIALSSAGCMMPALLLRFKYECQHQCSETEGMLERTT